MHLWRRGELLKHLLERGAAVVGAREREDDLEVGERRQVRRQRDALARALLRELVHQIP